MLAAEKIHQLVELLDRQSLKFATTGQVDTARNMLVTCECIKAALTAHLIKFQIGLEVFENGTK